MLWTQCPSGVQRGTCPGILAAVTWSGGELEGQGACERWNLGRSASPPTLRPCSEKKVGIVHLRMLC